MPGENLSDEVSIALPADLAPGYYTLLAGLYDEGSGQRLSIQDAAGQMLGDSLVLHEFDMQE
jgi:hypothetical protein